eukprot:6174379-Pleurochrysis_carterae.AAC.2
MTQCHHGPQRECFVDGFYSNLRFLIDRLIVLSEATRQISNSTDIIIAIPDLYYSYQASGSVTAKYGPIRFGDLLDATAMQESPLFNHRRVQFVNEEEFWLEANRQSRTHMKGHFITALNKERTSCTRPLPPCCNFTALPHSAKCCEYTSLHEALADTQQITATTSFFPTSRTTLLFAPSFWRGDLIKTARSVVPLFRTKIFEVANNSSEWRQAIPISLLQALAGFRFGPAMRETAKALLAQYGVHPVTACQQEYAQSQSELSQPDHGDAHAEIRSLQEHHHRSGQEKVVERCTGPVFIAVHMRRGNTYGIGGQGGQANLHEIVWALCRACDELSSSDSSCKRRHFGVSHQKYLSPLARFKHLLSSFLRMQTTDDATGNEAVALKNSASQRKQNEEHLHILIFAICLKPSVVTSKRLCI